MEPAQRIRLLQLTYAAHLAEATCQYGRAGILELVTEEMRARRRASGAAQAAQLGIATPADAFAVSADLFGCADWTVTERSGAGFSATATRCLLGALVKKVGGPSPCRAFCLDPIEAMVQGLDSSSEVTVCETLYDGERCRVDVTTRAKE